MPAKLVIHKFESDVNFKSLHVTIDDDENDFSEARYSGWSDGQSNKSKPAKSSQLVVKIVSEDDCVGFNLDSCAKQIEEPNTPFMIKLPSENSNNFTQNQVNSGGNEMNNVSTYPQEMYQTGSGLGSGLPNCTLEDRFEENTDSAYLSPLEYSLERVKQNNARIMENIHMLNRTLKYTKDKEIMGIMHSKTNRYSCSICGKCFVYETGLNRHNSLHHSMMDIQPRWQIVWTCIECFQVWPRHDLAVKHSTYCCKNSDADNIREIKTSLLLQCEFCEKVYTSIPRLLRHSKTHTTAKNYECNACDSMFPSYRAAEQHWLFCPWLQMCYKFFLPKMLLCNACDRKFKNYEQLYNHRYKAGHFMTKTYCYSIKSRLKSLGSLVYQCEMCSQWFHAIQPLQEHRNEHHAANVSIKF